jgi:hypothetical protein
MHFEDETQQLPFSMLVGGSQPLLTQLTEDSHLPLSQLVGGTLISRLDAEVNTFSSLLVSVHVVVALTGWT